MTTRLRQQRARWHNRFASGHRRNMVVALLSLLVAVATISAPVVQAQESASRQSSVLFVVDTSGSMSGSPLSQAKEALRAGIEALAPGQAAGLRSFSGSCGDGGRLLVPVATDNKDQLNAATTQLSADGGTPHP